jgi:hypothetical protein
VIHAACAASTTRTALAAASSTLSPCERVEGAIKIPAMTATRSGFENSNVDGSDIFMVPKFAIWEEAGARVPLEFLFPRSPGLDRWVAASRAGNSRPASGVTAPELEVRHRKHPAAQHETRAGSQQVLGEQLLGEVIRVFPDTRLKTWIQRGVLRAEPRLPTWCVRHPRLRSVTSAASSPGRYLGCAAVCRSGSLCPWA